MVDKLVKFKKIIKANAKYYILKNMNSKRHYSFYKKEYKKRTGEELNLKNPQKYSEKMQYSKLHLNTPMKTKLSDKYAVRDWVSEKIGEGFLIPLLGVWDSFSEIDFDSLPNKFVLKTNHSSGWNLVVEDKNHINFEKAKKDFDKWINRDFAYSGDIQLHYKDIEPKIIAEEFIEDSNGQLNDYRLLCFDGEVHFCWVGIDGKNRRYGNVYDLEWNLQPWTFDGLPNTPYEIKQPDNFKEMIDIAKKLSKEFSHVRVDLYNIDGKIYFGEMTFTSGGGYRLIHPEQYNYMLGNLWSLE